MPYFPLFSLHIPLVGFLHLFTQGEGWGTASTAFPRGFHKNCEIPFFIYVLELMLVVISFTVSAKAGSTRIFLSTCFKL